MGDSTYEGNIITPIENNTSANGKCYAKFTVKTTRGKLVPCVAWSHMCQVTSDFDILKKGAGVIVKGFYGKAQQKDLFGEKASSEKEFVVKWFGSSNVQEAEAESWSDKYIRICGGKSKAEQCFRRFIEQKRFQGQIYVFTDEHKKEWKDKADCVRYNGEWMHRIWYLQLVLTPEYVDRQFKRYSKAHDVGEKKNIPKYKAFLSALMDKAISYAPLEAKGTSLE